MRRFTVTAVLLALAGASTPTPALHAQSPISIGLAGGLSQPQGSLGDDVNPGWHALATVALSVPLMPFGLRLDGAYNRFGFSRTPIGSAGTSTGALRVTSVTVNPTFSVSIPFSPITPYLIGGAGSYNVGCAGGASCTSESKFGWNGGVGARVGALGLRGFAEARYHRVSTAGRTVEYVPITLGIMF